MLLMTTAENVKIFITFMLLLTSTENAKSL